jgi:hypothetical protein
MNAHRSLRELAPRDRLAAIADAHAIETLDVARASPHLARFGIAPQDDDGS